MKIPELMKSCSLVLAAAATGWAPAADASKVMSVSVTAEVAAVKGDQAQTEKRAKREARRMAVEQGAGTLVESNTIVRNYQLVADEIVTRANGVITQEEWGPLQVTGETAKIQLTASVSPEAISDAVCTVIKASHDPKISLVFVEKVGAEGEPWKVDRGLVEALFTKGLMDACFTIVEPGVKVTEVSANGDIPQETLTAIVKNAQAQYVLVASSKIVRAEPTALLKDSKMGSYSISLAGRLINVETNEVEAVLGEHQQVMGISPEHALKFEGSAEKRFPFVGKTLDVVLQQVAKRWSNDLVNQAKVAVIVQNVKNFKTAQAFDKAVKAAFPAAGLNRRSLRDSTGVYDIELEGGADELASGLEGRKVGAQSIEVLEVTRGKVVIKLN